MPDIYGLRQQTTKRLDMSEHFGKDAYITIKKLKRTTKKKLQLLQMDGALLNVAKEIMGEDGNLEDLTTMDVNELGKRFINLPQESKVESNKNAVAQEEIYLLEGVDPLEHNLTNSGEKVTLDIEFWEMFEVAALYVISQIKELNDAVISLGEQTESSLIM